VIHGRKSRNNGFTLIELIVAIVVLSIFATLSSYSYVTVTEEIAYGKTIGQSKILLETMERARKSVSSSNRTSGVTSHTYYTLAANSTVNDLHAFTIDTGIDNNNEYGYPYKLRITNNFSEVKTDFDGNVDIVDAMSVVYNGTTGRTTATFQLRKATNIDGSINDDHLFTNDFYQQDIR
jgi:prepilin-type N-terminal cleavage/methylation domain-containing protein